MFGQFSEDLGQIRQAIMGPDSTVVRDDEDDEDGGRGNAGGLDAGDVDEDDDDYEALDPLGGPSKMDGLAPSTAPNGAPLIADPAALMQAAFQPAATPEDQKRRYMCWNANGKIASFVLHVRRRKKFPESPNVCLWKISHRQA
jgi:hypothetical protein